jgi:hypothetical protein
VTYIRHRGRKASLPHYMANFIAVYVKVSQYDGIPETAETAEKEGET